MEGVNIFQHVQTIPQFTRVRLTAIAPAEFVKNTCSQTRVWSIVGFSNVTSDLSWNTVVRRQSAMSMINSEAYHIPDIPAADGS